MAGIWWRPSDEFHTFTTGDSIAASHIHAGEANSAEEIMVFTFAGPVRWRAEGVLNHGVIARQSQFFGAFNFDSLVTRLRAGTACSNVHSRRFPGGELRAQIER